MTARNDGLPEARELDHVAALLDDSEERERILRDAQSADPARAYLAQARFLLPPYHLSLPLLAAKLPRKYRDKLTNRRRAGSWRPARCLRCGGPLIDLACHRPGCGATWTLAKS